MILCNINESDTVIPWVTYISIPLKTKQLNTLFYIPHPKLPISNQMIEALNQTTKTNEKKRINKKERKITRNIQKNTTDAILVNLRDNPSYKFVYSICPIPYKSRSIVIVMYPGDKHQHTNCSVNVPHLPHSMNVLRPEQTYPPNEPLAQEKISENPMLLLTVFILLIYSRRCMRGFFLCIWNMLVVFFFAQGCLYLCVFLRQQKHRCATYIYAVIFMCNLWEFIWGCSVYTLFLRTQAQRHL